MAGAAKKAAPKKAVSKRAAAKTSKQIAAERKLRRAAEEVKEARESAKDLEVTSEEQWIEAASGVKIKLPSGKVCLARNPGMGAFVKKGMVPNSLMPIVLAAVNEGKGAAPKDLKALQGDSQVLQDMYELTDAVVVECVLKPELHPTHWTEDDFEEQLCELEEIGKPISRSRRLDNVLYIDMVDDQDKAFLFQWVAGGTRDLERFREESQSMLASLSSGSSVGESPE